MVKRKRRIASRSKPQSKKKTRSVVSEPNSDQVWNAINMAIRSIAYPEVGLPDIVNIRKEFLQDILKAADLCKSKIDVHGDRAKKAADARELARTYATRENKLVPKTVSDFLMDLQLAKAEDRLSRKLSASERAELTSSLEPRDDEEAKESDLSGPVNFGFHRAGIFVGKDRSTLLKYQARYLAKSNKNSVAPAPNEQQFICLVLERVLGLTDGSAREIAPQIMEQLKF